MNLALSPRRLRSGLQLAGLPLLVWSAAVVPAAEPALDKPFVLFMGAEIDVEQGKAVHRVKDVVDESFIIMVEGRPVEIPTNRGKISLKVSPQLKLSNHTAVVKGLKIERAYSPDNDPNRKWAAAHSGSAAQAAVGVTAGQMVSAMQGATQASLIVSRINVGGAGVGNAGAPTTAMEQTTIGGFERAQAAVGSDQHSAGYQAQLLQEELDKQLFDAVRVVCEVSAPQPMKNPYIVVITQYREKDDPPGAVKSWVFARALERLDEQPLKVWLLKGGFPEGFELVKQQFHLYGNGRELGTNVAGKNVALTRDEAHEYIVIDHLTTNKGATLAPSIVLGVGRRDFFPHFTSEQLAQEIYVRVDKAGLPRGVFRDEACAKPAGDDYLEGLVERVRFKPALQAGKAVEGVARLKIDGLAI